ncbi:MAG: hypothetical protein H0U66_00460 [Gemmatimonadaceae bacterium]|nr:hypothetical protein [Gemmatimonadaceae bacterium]
MSDRVLPAVIVSSAATAAVCVTGLMIGVSLVAGADKVTAEGVGHGALYFFFFGWPIAMLVTLAVARGSSHAPLAWRPVGALAVCAWAMIAGAIALPLVWMLFWAPSHAPWQMALIGAISGLAGGACYWLISQPGRG